MWEFFFTEIPQHKITVQKIILQNKEEKMK